ncbi:hypothetical protein PR048_016687 [Dryococelus australis]|uniref:Uncharacterized protein n=1 Tax=Dryococelus australis TaxID=614101 RepID=A0ABQ9H7L8_9NEOP|nr:hypothetical protein PR048_016687 [Dryococelus australis]
MLRRDTIPEPHSSTAVPAIVRQTHMAYTTQYKPQSSIPRGRGGTVARALASKENGYRFPECESCRTMPLVGGFPRGSPAPPPPPIAFQRCSTLVSLHPYRFSRIPMLRVTQTAPLHSSFDTIFVTVYPPPPPRSEDGPLHRIYLLVSDKRTPMAAHRFLNGPRAYSTVLVEIPTHHQHGTRQFGVLSPTICNYLQRMGKCIMRHVLPLRRLHAITTLMASRSELHGVHCPSLVLEGEWRIGLEYFPVYHATRVATEKATCYNYIDGISLGAAWGALPITRLGGGVALEQLQCAIHGREIDVSQACALHRLMDYDWYRRQGEILLRLGAKPLRLLGRKIMQGDMHRGREGLDSHGLHFEVMTTSLSVLTTSPNYEEQGEKPPRETEPPASFARPPHQGRGAVRRAVTTVPPHPSFFYVFCAAVSALVEAGSFLPALILYHLPRQPLLRAHSVAQPQPACCLRQAFPTNNTTGCSRSYSTGFGTSRARRSLSFQIVSYIFEWLPTTKGSRKAKLRRHDGGVKPAMHTACLDSADGFPYSEAVEGSRSDTSAADFQFACRTENLSASRSNLSSSTSPQHNYHNDKIQKKRWVGNGFNADWEGSNILKHFRPANVVCMKNEPCYAVYDRCSAVVVHSNRVHSGGSGFDSRSGFPEFGFTLISEIALGETGCPQTPLDPFHIKTFEACAGGELWRGKCDQEGRGQGESYPKVSTATRAWSTPQRPTSLQRSFCVVDGQLREEILHLQELQRFLTSDQIYEAYVSTPTAHRILAPAVGSPFSADILSISLHGRKRPMVSRIAKTYGGENRCLLACLSQVAMCSCSELRSSFHPPTTRSSRDFSQQPQRLATTATTSSSYQLSQVAMCSCSELRSSFHPPTTRSSRDFSQQPQRLPTTATTSSSYQQVCHK